MFSWGGFFRCQVALQRNSLSNEHRWECKWRQWQKSAQSRPCEEIQITGVGYHTPACHRLYKASLLGGSKTTHTHTFLFIYFVFSISPHFTTQLSSLGIHPMYTSVRILTPVFFPQVIQAFRLPPTPVGAMLASLLDTPTSFLVIAIHFMLLIPSGLFFFFFKSYFWE